MLPVSGSPARFVQPTRRMSMSASQTLNLYSHRTFPVSASKHMTRSWPVSPSPALLMKNTRPFMMMGVDRPPYGCFQTRLLFSAFGFGDQRSGRSFSRETPVCSGPRQCVQSAPRHGLATEAQRHREEKNRLKSDLAESFFMEFLLIVFVFFSVSSVTLWLVFFFIFYESVGLSSRSEAKNRG